MQHKGKKVGVVSQLSRTYITHRKMLLNVTLVNRNWLWIDPSARYAIFVNLWWFSLILYRQTNWGSVNTRVSTKMTETGAQQTCRPSLTMRPRLFPFCPVASFANKQIQTQTEWPAEKISILIVRELLSQKTPLWAVCIMSFGIGLLPIYPCFLFLSFFF